MHGHVLGQLKGARFCRMSSERRGAKRVRDLLCSNEELRPSPSLLLDIDIKIICNVHDGIAIWKLNMGSKSPEHQQTPDGMISAFLGKVPN